MKPNKNKKSPTQTPMMRQYLQIKANHQDAIVFYRLGDFYEMFFEDATIASQILELTLTARNKNSDEPIPMCGIPHHAAENYIAKLIQKGKKVVICDQVEDANQSKGIVKRDVTRVLTPGTVLEEQSLTAKTNNFILIVYAQQKSFQAVLCDISTGQLEYFSLKNFQQLQDELSRQPIREFLYPESLRSHKELQNLLKNRTDLYEQALSDFYFDSDFATDVIQSHYEIETIQALSLEKQMIAPIGALFSYLKDSKILKPQLLDYPKERSLEDYVNLDETTLTHLELFQVQNQNKTQGSLIWHMDLCITAMGSRKLAEIIRRPLLKQKDIADRLNSIEWFLENLDYLENTQNSLKNIYDIERLVNKFISNRANPKEAIALNNSLSHAHNIRESFPKNIPTLLESIQSHLHDFRFLQKKIDKTLMPDPPMSLKDGGIIADGIHKELDELREIEKNGKNYILKMEAQEKEKTGISSLKIRYNNVFGYYIEVTHTHKDKVPNHYIRKQTLTNAERYITEELKQYEAKVLGANERIKILEQELFQKLREEIAKHGSQLKLMSKALALFDVLQSFATLSKKFSYKKPLVTTEIILDLKEARHPIIERLNLGEPYIPNDIFLDSSGVSEMIITGPNMAGKSTVMRMTALIVLMAQIGCYVPCEQATIGICDRIFTRVGAHDSLQQGLSTFMVEMVETAKIIREATSKSLIILDEIGRGTSTFDGLSIAWSVAEDLHDRLKARTLFATHYHELCDLAAQKKGIANFHMQVKEYKDQIIFLRKLIAGGTNRSLGVAVAKMAGLPPSLVKRAKEILNLLEKKDLSFQADLDQTQSTQISLFENVKPESEVTKKLSQIDINSLTPLEALTVLADLKNEALNYDS